MPVPFGCWVQPQGKVHVNPSSVVSWELAKDDVVQWPSSEAMSSSSQYI